MRDTGRASCYCKDQPASLCLCLCRYLFGFLCILCALSHIDDMQKLFHALCIPKIICELLIHQQYRKFAEYIQMHIVFGVRRSDQKDQICLLTVQRLEIHTTCDTHCRKSRCLYNI